MGRYNDMQRYADAETWREAMSKRFLDLEHSAGSEADPECPL